MLTQTEREFLDRLGLPQSDVLDGRRLSQAEAKATAKREGKSLVLGSACKKAGHRLLARAPVIALSATSRR